MIYRNIFNNIVDYYDEEHDNYIFSSINLRYNLHIWDAFVQKKFTTLRVPQVVFINYDNDKVQINFYDGPRNVERILQWARKIQNPSYMQKIDGIYHLDNLNYKKALQDFNYIFLTFTENYCQSCEDKYGQLNKASKLLQNEWNCVIARVDSSNQETNLIQKQFLNDDNQKYPYSILIKNTKLHKAYISDQLTYTNILKFIQSEIDPKSIFKFEKENQILILNQDNIDIAIKQFPKIMLYFYENHCESCQLFKNTYEKVAKIAQNQNVTFAKINLNEKENNQMLFTRFWNKQIIYLPTLIYLQQPYSQIIYDGGKEQNQIIDWLIQKTDYSGRSILQTRDDVLQLTPNIFEKAIQKYKNILVKFVSDQCLSCYKWHKKYQDASKKIRQQKYDIYFAEYDLNSFNSEEIKLKYFGKAKFKFPTVSIKLIRYNGQVINYDRKYEQDDFITWTYENAERLPKQEL